MGQKSVQISEGFRLVGTVLGESKCVLSRGVLREGFNCIHIRGMAVELHTYVSVGSLAD